MSSPTSLLRSLLRLGLFALLVLLGSSCGPKGKEQGDPLALMPAEARLIGKIDVSRLRQTQLRDKILALRDRNETLKAKWQLLSEKAGLDPLRDVDTIFFSLMPKPEGTFKDESENEEYKVAVVIGRFNQPALVAWFKERSKGEAREQKRGARVIVTDGSASMSFLDSRTMVIGDTPLVEKALDLSDGRGQSVLAAPRMMDLLRRVRSNQVLSVVLTIPEEVRTRAGESPLKAMTTMLLSLDFAAGMDLDFKADCVEEKETRNLADRFNSTLKEILESPVLGSLGMGALIGGFKAYSEGKVFAVRGNVPPQQLDSLIRRIEEAATGKLSEGMPRLPLTVPGGSGKKGEASPTSLPSLSDVETRKETHRTKDGTDEGWPQFKLIPPGEGRKKQRPSLLGE